MGHRLLADFGNGERRFLTRFRPAFRAEHHDAPIHRCCAHRRKHSGSAGRKLHQRCGRIAWIRWCLSRVDAGVDSLDRPNETDESVNHVQPRASHTAARGFARVVAPAALHARRMLVGEISLDMQDLADDAVSHHTFELAHGGKTSLVVSESEGYAGLFRGDDRALRCCARESEWLFTPHRLARRRYGGNLRDMQGMWRCKKYSLNARVGDRVLEFGGQFEAFGRCKVADEVRLLAHPTNKAQPLAFPLHGFDDIFSPSAKADHGGIDH